MAKLRLSARKADQNGPLLSVVFGGEDPFPSRDVDIRTADDAVRELSLYAADARATGEKLCVFANLHPGERAPRGFRKILHRQTVNLD